MPNWKRLLAVGVLGVALLAAGCGGTQAPAAQNEPTTPQQPSTPQTIELHGAGASFPNPLYQKWFYRYHEEHPNVQISYQSIGSGGGQKAILEKTVDFAGSDAPMKDEQLASAPGKILHIPTVMGAVVITYNLPDVTQPLKMTPEVVADIFLGKIKKWNDPKLVDLNPDANLPNMDISVVHRSDGSGTTNIFTDYLSKVSPEWKEKVGMGTAVEWPVGVGAKGNEGVSGQVKQTPGAIGYVELAYAIQNKLPTVLLKNQAGEFVEASIDGVVKAAAGFADQMPDDFRISIVNAPGSGAYPIAAYTYLLIYQEQSDEAKGKALVDMIAWVIQNGDADARELLYAPLPDNVKKKVLDALKTVTYNGKPLLGN